MPSPRKVFSGGSSAPLRTFAGVTPAWMSGHAGSTSPAPAYSSSQAWAASGAGSELTGCVPSTSGSGLISLRSTAYLYGIMVRPVASTSDLWLCRPESESAQASQISTCTVQVSFTSPHIWAPMSISTRSNWPLLVMVSLVGDERAYLGLSPHLRALVGFGGGARLKGRLSVPPNDQLP